MEMCKYGPIRILTGSEKTSRLQDDLTTAKQSKKDFLAIRVVTTADIDSLVESAASDNHASLRNFAITVLQHFDHFIWDSQGKKPFDPSNFSDVVREVGHSSDSSRNRKRKESGSSESKDNQEKKRKVSEAREGMASTSTVGEKSGGSMYVGGKKKMPKKKWSNEQDDIETEVRESRVEESDVEPSECGTNEIQGILGFGSVSESDNDGSCDRSQVKGKNGDNTDEGSEDDSVTEILKMSVTLILISMCQMRSQMMRPHQLPKAPKQRGTSPGHILQVRRLYRIVGCIPR